MKNICSRKFGGVLMNGQIKEYIEKPENWGNDNTL